MLPTFWLFTAEKINRFSFCLVGLNINLLLFIFVQNWKDLAWGVELDISYLLTSAMLFVD